MILTDITTFDKETRDHQSLGHYEPDGRRVSPLSSAPIVLLVLSSCGRNCLHFGELSNRVMNFDSINFILSQLIVYSKVNSQALIIHLS